MFNTVGQQTAHHSERQDRSAHALHPDVGDQSGSLVRAALSTGYEPNFIQPQRKPNFISTVEKMSARTISTISDA